MTDAGQSWRIFVAPVLALMTGCASLGPDFTRPETPEASSWLTKDDALSGESLAQAEWWKVFNDPVLDTLIQTAYHQNLTLQVAGLRILEARAQLGIAIGNRYPQLQQARGSVNAVEVSENSPNFSSSADDSYTDYQVGFDAAWELDFWGRFRRGIESAEANLSGNVADYDDALVSLTAEVARTYVVIRSLQERLELAHSNITLQQDSLRIAEVRFRHGATTDLDVQQAISNLSDTQALVPALKRSLRNAKNGLSILLGMPPSDLTELLGGSEAIPVAPAQAVAGIPAELLRRRPDIRKAEMQASSQSALIGVAEADLYPSFSLVGSIGYQTSDTGSSSSGDLFDSDSLTFFGGPVFSWNILNYGRIRNNIRVQDARYQQAIVNYQESVLRAYQEVEDAMSDFVLSREETAYRKLSAEAAFKATRIASIQYREGAVDFQRVIDSERALVAQQDQWTDSRGNIALNLIALYKALGGGWEIREGNDFISRENRDVMQQRTNWGNLLEQQDAADTDKETKRQD